MAYQYQANLYRNRNHNHNHYSAPADPAEEPVSPLISPVASDFPLPTGNALSPLAPGRNDANALTSPHTRDIAHMMPRSPSISSISNASTLNSHIATTPANIYPPPAYVASFGASQIVSERRRRISDDEDDDEALRTPTSARDAMHFSQAALALVNGFLDQLLFSFLGNAKSTTLTALRPAVRDVLKSRLATEAIASAEEELQELLAGGEDEDEMDQKQSIAERNRSWDTELVWKRTRLRVMVYIRLGEMEDEDEERFVKDTELLHGSDRRFSHSTGLVSWAAAIFLTSVLEYIAEQVLQAAGNAADARARRQSKNPRSMSASGMASPVDGTTVEDHDMEKVALNSAMGRLWRTWRKSQRSNTNGAPATSISSASHNNFSRRLSKDPLSPRRRSSGGAAADSVSAVDESRRPSMAVDEKDVDMDEAGDMPEAEYTEDVLAANIPLPLDAEKRDVEEIEVPGLAKDPDEAETGATQTQAAAQLKRRSSITGPAPHTVVSKILAMMGASGVAAAESSTETSTFVRQRSQSVPTQARSIFPDSFIAAAPVDVQAVSQGQESLAERKEQDVPAGEDVAGVPEAVPVAEVGGQVIDEAQGEISLDTRHSAEDEDLPFVEAEEYHTGEALADELDVDEVPPVSKAQTEASGQREAREHSSSDDTVTTVKALQSSEKAVKEEAELLDSPVQTQEESVEASQVTSEDLQRALLKTVAPGSAAAAEAAFLIVYGDRFSKEETSKPVPEANDSQEQKDEQESEGDMKRSSLLAGTQTSQIETIPEESQAQEEKPRSHDLERPPTVQTQEPFSLANHNGQAGALQQMYVAEDEDLEDVADIGVARTSDVRTEEIPVEHRHARDSYRNSAYGTPRRQSRLILVGSPESPKSSRRQENVVVGQSDSTTTPQGFLQERSLVAPKSPGVEQIRSKSSALQNQTRLPPASHRASLPSALGVPKGTNSTPAQEKAPALWRQSFSAATEKTASWVSAPKKPSISESSSEAPKEHPVLQRLASMKRTDKEDKFPLTSASIRGPEDFDMFVQGGDTLKYTLTPENVRDDPVPPKHAVGSAARSDAGQAQPEAEAQPRSSSATERTATSSKQAQSLDMRAGRSHSFKQVTAATPLTPTEPEDLDADFQPRKDADKRRSISRPPIRNTSVHRRSGLMPREPTVQTESTRDFADFIRSTGPTKDQEVTPILTSKSTTSLHSLRTSRSSVSRSSSPGGASMRSLNRATMRSETAPPMPAMPKVRSNMLPRSAISSGEGSSELINFIRGGPSGDAVEPGQKRRHRISRSIAPFRTTMDSDQLQEWGDRVAVQPDLKLNTAVTSAPSLHSASSIKSSSHRTSANSRSALLPSASTTDQTVQPAYNGQPQRLSQPTTRTPLSALPPDTSVKRYRNKDPYAIDMSDEDEDLLTALPRGKREEESLIDFLRSSGPSEKAGPNPADSEVRPHAQPPPARRASAPAAHVLNAMGVDAATTGARRGFPPATKPSTDGPATVTNFSRNGTTTVAIGPITKPRPKFEARPGSKTRENTTGDLADFLRSSGPPAEPPTFPRQVSKSSILSGSNKSGEKKPRKSFWSTSLFSRKSGTVGRAYLDM